MAKSTFADTPTHNCDLLRVDEEESDSLNRVAELSEGSQGNFHSQIIKRNEELKNDQIHSMCSQQPTLRKKRSSSLNEDLSNRSLSATSDSQVLVYSGTLLKKGIIFYNTRFVTINVKGLLQYYDPKNLIRSRAQIELADKFTVAFIRRKKKCSPDSGRIEIVTPEASYIFKVSSKVTF